MRGKKRKKTIPQVVSSPLIYFTCGDLNTRGFKILWVTRCTTLPLPELLQVFHLHNTQKSDAKNKQTNKCWRPHHQLGGAHEKLLPWIHSLTWVFLLFMTLLLETLMTNLQWSFSEGDRLLELLELQNTTTIEQWVVCSLEELLEQWVWRESWSFVPGRCHSLRGAGTRIGACSHGQQTGQTCRGWTSRGSWDCSAWPRRTGCDPLARNPWGDLDGLSSPSPLRLWPGSGWCWWTTLPAPRPSSSRAFPRLPQRLLNWPISHPVVAFFVPCQLVDMAPEDDDDDGSR